jgi:hypothetical protein
VAPARGVDESTAAEIESVAEDLGLIAERIADLAMRSLRTAISRRDFSRPQLERQLTRARHAVERAIGILSTTGDPGAEDDPGADGP